MNCKAPEAINGVLNINKPAGLTSHDVVDRIRMVIHQKKVGHTGTLDPDATGVLPVCIGRATKIAQSISATFKVYRGCMRLGIRTDTQDSTGKILSERPIANVKKEQIDVVFSKFTGEIEQVPPMYSAVKYKGKRLYKLARKGITVERKPKKKIVYYLRIIDFEGDLVNFDIKTSPGTYVRTICDEAGESLKCGAHLKSLARINVGPFGIESAISISEVEKRYTEGTIEEVLYPIDKVLENIEIVNN